MGEARMNWFIKAAKTWDIETLERLIDDKPAWNGCCGPGLTRPVETAMAITSSPWRSGCAGAAS